MAQLWQPCSSRSGNKLRRNAGRYLVDGDKVLAFDVGQTDLAECLLVVDTGAWPPFKIQRLGIVDIGSGTVTSSVQSLCSIAVSSKGYWADADFVVIEQQARINTKMVALSHALQACLLTLGMAKRRAVPQMVCFASSLHKFAIFERLGESCRSLIHPEPRGGSAQQKKTVRKNNALRLADAMLAAAASGPGTEALSGIQSGQRDDLADALVHASGFVYRNVLIVAGTPK